MGKYLAIPVFFQGEGQTLSEMVNLSPVLIAIAHGTDTQTVLPVPLPGTGSGYTKEQKEWSQGVFRMLFKMEKRGKAKIMKEKIKKMLTEKAQIKQAEV